MSRSVNTLELRRVPSRARQRVAHPVGRPAGTDAARRGLCAAIFDNPARITDALHHRVVGRVQAPPHHHADLLQLDVIHACAGQATLGETTHRIQGLTLIAVPPGLRHGYDLQPAGHPTSQAAVWLLKVRVGTKPWPRGGEPFPSLLTGLPDQDEFIRNIAGFVSDWTPSGIGLTALARLSQACATWPFNADPAAANTATNPRRSPPQDSLSGRIREAVETLGHRFDDPPDLEELAAAAGVSGRHFARRFRLDFGCTPHAYLAARRLDVARGLLRDANQKVGGVAEQLGFSSPAAFSRWFTRLAGQSPRAFRSDPNNS